MRAARAAAVVLALLAFASLLPAQTQPNLENGYKPYGTYDETSIDSVTVMNGNLQLHIPLPFSYAQRGGRINRTYQLESFSKTWMVIVQSSNSNGTTYAWATAQPTGFATTPSTPRLVPSTLLTVNRSTLMDSSPEGVVEYDDYGYYIMTADGGTHSLVASASSPSSMDSSDTSGFHLQLSNPASGTGYPQTAVVTDRAGNVYQFGGFTGRCSVTKGTDTSAMPPYGSSSTSFGADTVNYCSEHATAQSVTDANGNVINFPTTSSGTFTTPPTDTLGRAAFTWTQTTDYSDCVGTVNSADLYTFNAPAGGSSTLKLCSTNITLSTFFNIAAPSGGVNVVEYQNSANHPALAATTTAVLPDHSKYTFNYDSYGLISSIGLPTGGSISYTWLTVAPPPCSNSTKVSRGVATRTLNDGAGHTSTWTFSYGAFANGVESNTVTDPAGNDTVHVFTVVDGSCILYETTTRYYQGSSATGTLLKQIDTHYLSALLQTNDAFGDTSYGNVVADSVKTTIFPTNQVSQVLKTFDPPQSGTGVIFGQALTEKEYDWGTGARGALLRETDTAYLWQSNSSYLNAHLVDLPASVITKDGVGNRVAETDYGYDDPARLSGATVSMQHTSPPNGVRGNATSVSHWLNTSNSFLTSYTNWYDTGEAYQSIDPLGHTTIYAYSPSFYGAYLTQTNMPDTGSPAVHHIISGNYDFNTGLLTSFTDQNSQTSTYAYDSMWRLTTANFPDGGQTTFNYPNTTTVERLKKLTSTVSDDAYTYFDGLGRMMQTKHVTPPGNVLVDTTYDSLGRVSTVSNPYISSSDPTYGVTTHLYDALGRETTLVPPDGTTSQNNVTTAYNGDCTTTTDQAGKQREVCTDGLGRLVQVYEPNPSSVSTPATGSVSISSFNSNGTDESYTQSGAPGTGSVTIGGTLDSWCVGLHSCTTVYDAGNATITVNGVNMTVSYSGSATTTVTIATALKNAINNSGSYPVTATLSGSTITLTAKTLGTVTNYSLSASIVSTNDPDGTLFTTSKSGPNLTGGLNTTTFWDAGTVTVTINGTPYQLSYGSSDTTTTLATRLAGAINAGTLVQATASGNTVNLTSRAAGSGTNYSLTASYTFNSTNFAHPSFTTSTSGATLTGGTDAQGLNNNPLITLYNYDALGNLLCVEQHGAVTGSGCSADPSNDATSAWRVRRFTYDSLSRLLTAKNVETGTVSWGYDNDSRVTSKTDARNITITYSYDPLERVLGKTYSNGDPAVGYSYDSGTNGIGRETGMTDATGSSAITYDVMGRVAIEQRTINIAGLTSGGVSKQATYHYNLDGSVKDITYPSGRVVNYAYDSAGEALSATQTTANYVTSATYSPIGALSSAIYGQSGTFAGYTLSNSYNNRLQPTYLSASGGPGTVLSLSYCYNQSGCVGSQQYMINNGDIVKITNNKDNNRSQNFTYDAVNRILSAKTDGANWGNTYVIDSWGNLTQMNQVAGKTNGQLLQQSVNAKNQFDDAAISYDASGNMTKDGTNTYSFDGENRIACVGTSICYYYDGNGERVAKTGGPLYWNGTGADALAESNTAGTLTREYVFFNGKRVARVDLDPTNGQDTARYFFFQDHLGSSNVVTDSSGLIKNESDFYPYGGEIVITQTLADQKFKFTGKERDPETGLDYFFARYYSNQFGRFLTPDWSATPAPVPYANLGSPQSLNLYAYVQNNPVTGIDPDGHCCPGLGDMVKGILNATGNDLGVEPRIENGNEDFKAGQFAGDFSTAVAGAYLTVSTAGTVGALDAYSDGGAAIAIPVPVQLAIVAAPGAVTLNATLHLAKDVPNPFGAAGKPDHQAKVGELTEKAKAEAKPGETVENGTKIKGHDSSRKPDVHIVDKTGKTRKTFEAERHPTWARNKNREAEYKKLKIPTETHPLDKKPH